MRSHGQLVKGGKRVTGRVELSRAPLPKLIVHTGEWKMRERTIITEKNEHDRSLERKLRQKATRQSWGLCRKKAESIWEEKKYLRGGIRLPAGVLQNIMTPTKVGAKKAKDLAHREKQNNQSERLFRNRGTVGRG